MVLIKLMNVDIPAYLEYLSELVLKIIQLCLLGRYSCSQQFFIRSEVFHDDGGK